MLDRVVVVGGSLAALSATRALRQFGFTGRLTILCEEAHDPYDRPPLSKECLSGSTGFEGLALVAPDWYARNGVEMLRARPALALDAAGRRVLLSDGATLDFDAMVIATGSAAIRLAGAAGARGPMVLRTIDDCRALKDVLPQARTMLVVGAGFIGLEVAATAADLGLAVTVVEQAPVPLARDLGDDIGRWFVDLHRQHSVDVRCGIAAESVAGDVGDYTVQLSDGSAVRADVVVTAIGARPRTDWLVGSGVVVGDGVVCDEYCRTSVDGIVAAGDVARWYNPLFDQQMRVEHWRNAVDQGAAAAAALIGRPEPYRAVPYFWSDQYDARLRFVGQSFAATDVALHRRSDDSFVALYGRDGRLTGVLGVNATSALSMFSQQIQDRLSWQAARESLFAHE